MENFIIIALLTVAVTISIIKTVKHFKCKGGCCGGSDYKVKKKKFPEIAYNKKFRVEGMHCEHCKRRVEEIINDIDGVVGKVNLKDSLLTVSYAKDIDDDLIKKPIERAGYKITNF